MGTIRKFTNELAKKINDIYINHFGFTKEHHRRLKLIAKIQLFKSKFARSKNNRWITQLMIAERELEVLMGKDTNEKVDEYDVLTNVQLSLDGIHIDPQQMAMMEYYSKQKSASKRNAQIRKKHNKRK